MDANLYRYVGNSPTNYTDPSGNAAHPFPPPPDGTNGVSCHQIGCLLAGYKSAQGCNFQAEADSPRTKGKFRSRRRQTRISQVKVDYQPQCQEVKVDYPKLSPQDFCAFANRRFGDFRQVLRPPKHINYFHLIGNRFEIRIAAFAGPLPQRLRRKLRIHRNDAKSFALEQQCDFETVARRIIRTSNHRNCRGLQEDCTDLIIIRIVECHVDASSTRVMSAFQAYRATACDTADGPG